MATKKFHRYGILIILIVTVVGTIGSFAVMILATKGQAEQQARIQKLQGDYQKEMNAYQAKVDAQNDGLSAQYYPTFSSYADHVGAFDADAVKSLENEDLLVGDGEEVTGTTKFVSYYILWRPDGHIVQQSIDPAKQKLNAPLAVADGLDNASLIAGWKEGMKGMHLGGVRLLSIPSDKAYGEKGQGNDIPPNTPLKFIVMAVPQPTAIAQPTVPAELLSLYGTAS